MSAPTRGWVAVGLNDRPTLDGNTRRSLGGREQVLSVRGTERDGVAAIEVVLGLNADGVAPSLVRGRLVHMTLAYSEEADFAHHSRMRSARDVVF